MTDETLALALFCAFVAAALTPAVHAFITAFLALSEADR